MNDGSLPSNAPSDRERATSGREPGKVADRDGSRNDARMPENSRSKNLGPRRLQKFENLPYFLAQREIEERTSLRS